MIQLYMLEHNARPGFGLASLFALSNDINHNQSGPERHGSFTQNSRVSACLRDSSN